MASHISIDGPEQFLIVDEEPADVQTKIAGAGGGLIQLSAQATQTTDAGTVWVNPARIVTVRER